MPAAAWSEYRFCGRNLPPHVYLELLISISHNITYQRAICLLRQIYFIKESLKLFPKSSTVSAGADLIRQCHDPRLLQHGGIGLSGNICRRIVSFSISSPVRKSSIAFCQRFSCVHKIHAARGNRPSHASRTENSHAVTPRGSAHDNSRGFYPFPQCKNDVRHRHAVAEYARGTMLHKPAGGEKPGIFAYLP